MASLPTVVALVLLLLATAARAAEPREWTRLSPFTDVEFFGDAVLVDHGARSYHLHSVNDVPTREILAFCKRSYAAKWEERFATDLPDVLADMGHKPAATVKLVLRDPETGQVTTLARAPMTAENRRAVRRAIDARPQTPDQMRRALDAFQAALEERWSYLPPSRFDHRGSIAGIRQRVDAGLIKPQFLRELQKVIGQGIDGHAAVAGWDRDLPTGYLPFLVEPVGDRFVAFLPDRAALLAEDLPYIESIDDRALAAWLDAAAAHIPNGSPQYVRQHALRYLRAIQFLRQELGLQQSPTVDVTLASADAARRRTLRLKVSASVPTYGVWPLADYKPALPAGIAYLRLTEMADDDAGALARALRDRAAADALIIDVRDNGGGLRDALRHVAAFLLKPDDKPRVVNTAVYRLHPDHGSRRMEDRYLYPERWTGWSPVQRAAIADFRKSFRPEYAPPAGAYSDWHYMLLTPAPGARPFANPVVVLMNEKCFSATDVFLSALKGLPNVTLVGTPSGGGSAHVNTVTLPATAVQLRLGTILSFQRDGRFFDTRGVTPDVIAHPTPNFFVGGPDAQLQQAIDILQQKIRPK